MVADTAFLFFSLKGLEKSLAKMVRNLSNSLNQLLLGIFPGLVSLLEQTTLIVEPNKHSNLNT